MKDFNVGDVIRAKQSGLDITAGKEYLVLESASSHSVFRDDEGDIRIARKVSFTLVTPAKPVVDVLGLRDTVINTRKELDELVAKYSEDRAALELRITNAITALEGHGFALIGDGVPRETMAEEPTLTTDDLEDGLVIRAKESAEGAVDSVTAGKTYTVAGSDDNFYFEDDDTDRRWSPLSYYSEHFTIVSRP